MAAPVSFLLLPAKDGFTESSEDEHFPTRIGFKGCDLTNRISVVGAKLVGLKNRYTNLRKNFILLKVYIGQKIDQLQLKMIPMML